MVNETENDCKFLSKKDRDAGFLLHEEPFVYSVIHRCHGKVCNNCLKRKALDRCSSCKTVFYCSSECQNEHWKNLHKYVCKYYKMDIHLLTRSRLLLLLMLKKKRNVNCKDANGDDVSFNDLISHKDRLMMDRKKMNEFYTILNNLKIIMETDKSKFPELDIIIEQYGKIMFNSMAIQVQTYVDEESVATGIYLGLSKLNHSCKFNVTPLFDGKKLDLYASVPIKKGEEMTITYDPTITYIPKSREYIENHYYFTCNCNFCGDKNYKNLHTISRCICSGPIIYNSESNSINCLKCENTSYDQDYINSRNNYLKELEVVYENLFGRGHKDDKITKEEDAILNPFLKRYQEMIHVRNNKIFWLINQYNCGIDESIYAYYIDLFDMEQEFFFGLYSGDAGLLYFKLASYYSHISLEKAISFLYKSRKCFGFLPKTYQIHEKIDYYLNMLK